MLRKAIDTLEEIVAKQKTVATSKLGTIVAAIKAEIDAAERTIESQRQELESLRKLKRKHKLAMQDYENLKVKHRKVKDEYQHLVRKQEEANKLRRRKQR